MFVLFTMDEILMTAMYCRFDTSKGRGAFKTAIGVGKVIRGTQRFSGRDNTHLLMPGKQAGTKVWQR